MKRKSYGRDAGLTARMVFTTFLLGLLYVVFVVVLIVFLKIGIVPVLLIVIGFAFFQYFTSDKLALAAAGAKIVIARGGIRRCTTWSSACARWPTCRSRRSPSWTPRCRTRSRPGALPKHAAVCVTTGLWDRLEPKEVEGVLAHELSHIANRDVLIMTLASFFAMLAAMLTRFGLYAGMWGGGGGATTTTARRSG